MNLNHDSSQLNIVQSYVRRYIRLTTSLIPVILFTIGPLFYMSNGPEWTSRTTQIIGFCERYWWSALLHVQNYVNPFEVVSKKLLNLKNTFFHL